MKRVLIIGASGFVGSNLAVLLRRKYRVLGTHAHHPIQIDDILSFRFPLTPSSDFPGLLRLTHPDVIVYCAAERNEERCRKFLDECFYVNATALTDLSRAITKELDSCKLIYLSTSKVFSGMKGSYVESDEPDGDSQYGTSKLRGEGLLEGNENTFILRLGTLFGISAWGQDSMFNRLLLALWRQEMTTLVQDERRSFLGVDDLCNAIEKVIETKDAEPGLYHLGTNTPESYFEFGQRIANAFKLSDKGLVGISGKSFTGHGFRPEDRGSDLSLCGDHFNKTFQFTPRDTDFSLRVIQNRLRKGL